MDDGLASLERAQERLGIPAHEHDRVGAEARDRLRGAVGPDDPDVE
ncbi:MAG: hypothetical protein U0599_14230 [Vicinamibacteria bacterium]